MRTNREDLLRRLEAVAAGLAVKEHVEQSSCFVFKAGMVVTFNDEIACTMECDLAGLEGAVPSKPLLELLQRMTEKEVDIQHVTDDEGKSKLVVKGKGRRANIILEAQITLPFSAVDVPEEWADLDPEFADAIAVVQKCASKDANIFHMTCVHVTPTHVEACDNYQLARYIIDTGVTEPCLVKRDSIKHVTGLGMTEVCETQSWLHFRNPTGLTFSVRRELMEFEELDHILAMGGAAATLPGGLAEAVEKAEIFSGENSESNTVKIELRKNQLRLRGEGASGWFEERKAVNYDGEDLTFGIDPKLLIEVASRTNDCFIAPGRLKIDGGKFIYMISLDAVQS